MNRSSLTTPTDVTLFVACYNEAANIIGTLETVRAALQKIGCSCDLIVIDDASSDASAALVQAYREAHPELSITLQVNPANRGLARNFAAASFQGRGRYYKLVCGDNVESVEALTAILSRLGEADLVLSYHRHCEGKGVLRTFLSRTFTGLVNLLSGHRLKYYNGLGLYRREHVMRWHSRTTGFGFQADLVTRLLDEGFHPLEVEVPARERAGGTSHVLRPRNFLAVSRTLLEIFLRRLRKSLHRV